MRYLLMIVVLVLCSVCVRGVEFKTTSAKLAHKSYQKSLQRIQRKYVLDLKKELSKAMRSENLEEALLIKNEISKFDISNDENKKIIKTLCSGEWGDKSPIFKFNEDGTGMWCKQSCKWEIRDDFILIHKGKLTEKLSVKLNPKGTVAYGTDGKRYKCKQFE